MTHVVTPVTVVRVRDHLYGQVHYKRALETNTLCGTFTEDELQFFHGAAPMDRYCPTCIKRLKDPTAPTVQDLEGGPTHSPFSRLSRNKPVDKALLTERIRAGREAARERRAK